ncbi:MAG: glycosyltransferase 87 family protein [Defluviicoccus sp.]
MAAGAGMLLLNGLALAAHGRWDADVGFVAVVLVQGTLYLVAARLLPRAPSNAATLAIIVAVAAAMRLSLLFEPPLHSSDIYRYIWDGRVQAAGISPYRYVPADPALAALRDDAIYPNINRADYAVTIYPPAAQAAFRLFTRVAETVWAMKLGWLALEAAAMLVLVRLLVRSGQPASQLLLYAWHPLPVWEIAADGHVDAGMAAFLVFALAAWAARYRFLAGGLLAISVLFKPTTLVAIPAFWRRWDWRVPVAFAGVVVAAYLPYAELGAKAFGFLAGYVGEEGIGSGQGFLLVRLFALFGPPLPRAVTVVYVAVAAALLAGLALVFVADRRRDVVTAAQQAQMLILVFLILLSPNYPWYFLALVPLGCLSRWMPARLTTVVAMILYAAPPHDAEPRTVLVQSILYGTVMAALAVDLYTRRRRTADTAAGPRARAKP